MAWLGAMSIALHAGLPGCLRRSLLRRRHGLICLCRARSPGRRGDALAIPDGRRTVRSGGRTAPCRPAWRGLHACSRCVRGAGGVSRAFPAGCSAGAGGGKGRACRVWAGRGRRGLPCLSRLSHAGRFRGGQGGFLAGLYLVFCAQERGVAPCPVVIGACRDACARKKAGRGRKEKSAREHGADSSRLPALGKAEQSRQGWQAGWQGGVTAPGLKCCLKCRGACDASLGLAWHPTWQEAWATPCGSPVPCRRVEA